MQIETFAHVSNFPLTPAQAGVGTDSANCNPMRPYPSLRWDERT